MFPPFDRPRGRILRMGTLSDSVTFPASDVTPNKPLKSARKSRNSIFNDSWSFSSPTTSSPVLGSHASSPSASPLLAQNKTRPSPPTVRIEPPQPPTSKVLFESPATTKARVEAWDTVDSTDLSVPSSPHLTLKTTPSRPFLLGVGRHASVFLAACAFKDDDWRPCAAKRMNADRESQLGGFREAYILSRLYDGGKGPKSILRMLALRDERDAGPHSKTASHRSREHARSNSEAGGHDGLPLSPSSTMSPEMTRGGSQSTPNSPTVPTNMGMTSAPAVNVRRAFSMRVPPTSTSREHTPRHEKRMSWNSEATTTEVTDPPRLVLVLELCPEGNLATLLQKRPEMAGKRLWLKWAKALAEAVAHAHQMGFMHADIKPGNVMLTADLDVRLADWGMSLPISPDRLPTEGLGLGTTLYCAPEMVQAPPCPFSFPADIFAFGVTLNVLITGREPYRDARSPVEQMLWVSRGSYWQYEERHRLSLIGSTLAHSGSAQSLGGRSRANTSEFGGSRPPSRVSSVRSLRSLAAETFTETAAPDLQDLLGPSASRESIHVARMALSRAAAGASFDDVADVPQVEHPTALVSTYSDGTPVQYFLDGRDTVPEGIRSLLKQMTLPDPDARPSARDVLATLSLM